MVRAGSIFLLRFAWLEALSCLFAAGIFVGLLLTYLVDLPWSRYDVMFVWCVGLTLGFWVAGLESWREVLVICAFHALGSGLEIFKVHQGSWSYPGEAALTIAGVPLFAGFMYAAVGSYICQAWHRFDLRVPLALLGLVVLRRTWVHFTVGPRRHRMPLALSFVLIGLFLWVAENAATFLGAWQYPDQASAWRAVHAAKIGAWALLVTMGFVLVASVKAQEGRLYHRHPER